MRFTKWFPLVAVCASATVLQAQGADSALRNEVETLLSQMVTAFKTDPSTVAQFYADDATIAGGGGRYTGRDQIDQYWRGATMFADWKLEVLDVGAGARPWVRGRSTLVGKSGRTMVTEFIGLLKRHGDGTLRFYLDMYVAAR